MSLTRISIWLGFISSLPLAVLKHRSNATSTKAKIIQALADADYIKDWPPDSAGGSLFDAPFKKLDEFSHYAEICYWLGTSLLFFTLLFDLISHLHKSKARKWLACTQIASFFTLIFVFAAVILPSIPNYVGAANLNTVYQKCNAPKFDKLVQKIFGGVIGTAAQIYLILNLFPVLLSISPTAIRVATLSLKDLTNYYENRYPSGEIRLDEHVNDGDDDDENHHNLKRSDTIVYEENSRHLLSLIHLSAFISPMLTALPLSLFYQILVFQDISSSLPTTLGALIALFIIVPIFLELPIIATSKSYKTNYYLYVLTYIGLLIGIIGYLSKFKPIHTIIIKELKSAEFYLTLIAEISVSNVIFGNLISFFIKF